MWKVCAYDEEEVIVACSTDMLKEVAKFITLIKKRKRNGTSCFWILVLVELGLQFFT